MAYSETQWLEAKTLFELGKSLREIEIDTGISKGQISKRATKEGWEAGKRKQLKTDVIEYEKQKETIERKKETLVYSLAELTALECTVISNVVEEELGVKSLVFSTATLNLARQNALLTKNKKQVIVKVKQYSDGMVVGEEPEIMEMELDAQDLERIANATDKSSITTKVNDRHAPKAETNITNAMQIQVIDPFANG